MRRLSLDRAAIGLSGLCMVHCLASVAGLFALGVMSVFAEVEAVFHQVLLAIMLPVSILAIGAGYRRHRRLWVLLPGLLALVALTVLTVLEPVLHGTGLEPVLTTLAGLSLMAAHLGNIRACRHCEAAHQEASPAP